MARCGFPEEAIPIEYKTESDLGYVLTNKPFNLCSKDVIQVLPLVATIGFLVWAMRSVFGRASKLGQGGPGGIFSVGKSKAKYELRVFIISSNIIKVVGRQEVYQGAL